MALHHRFQSAVNGLPDGVALQVAIRSSCGDASAGVSFITWPEVIARKATDWTAPQIAATQAAINACPALTPQKQAQNEIDQWPISMRAFALTLIDQINVLRTQVGLSTVTGAQALAAIRAKAGTL